MTDASTLPATHTVVAGDTPGGIATQYGLTLDDLLRFNTISDPNLIQVGQVINLVGQPEDMVYTVVEGDTVSELAVRFGKRWVEIAAANKLEDMDLIYVGQQLTIPAQGFAR